jgi:phage recombination protein Bet
MQTQKRVEPGALAVYLTDHGKLELSVGQITQYLCPSATPEEAYLFLMLCQAQRLNPLIKEAYLIVYGKDDNRKVSMIVARDVFIRRAEAHPLYAGFKAGVIVEMAEGNVEDVEGALVPTGGKLLGGWSKVFRKDRQVPHYTTISYAEYNTGRSTWTKMPGTMCRKVAIVQGFREAFPTISVGMDANVTVGDPGDVIEGEGRIVPDAALTPPAPHQTAPAPRAAPGRAPQAPASAQCDIHGVTMAQHPQHGVVHGPLKDGTFCNGVLQASPGGPQAAPLARSTEDHDRGLMVESPSADAPEGFPPGQSDDQAALENDVIAAGLTWNELEVTFLQMRWAIWHQKGHTVAEAMTRIQNYQRKPRQP